MSDLSPPDATRGAPDRTIRLQPPSSAFGRGLLRLKDAFEAWIARHSVHPDLPVYAPESFPWVQRMEAASPAIREEVLELLNRREDMPDFHNILEPVSTITQDQQWKTFFLTGPAMDCRENQAQCPHTMAALEHVPGLETAMFSILSPGKHIPPHRGAYNGLLRFHLGLVVPRNREQCRIRIDQEIHHWTEGKSLLFDDTYQHEVWNETDEVRVVLFVDFARPMKAPWAWVNRLLLSLAFLSPSLRKANRQQKAWAKTFYANR